MVLEVFPRRGDVLLSQPSRRGQEARRVRVGAAGDGHALDDGQAAVLGASGQTGAVVAAALAARLVAAHDAVVREPTTRAPGRRHHLIGGWTLGLIEAFASSGSRAIDASAVALGGWRLGGQGTFG